MAYARGRADVTALAVRDHEQAGGARVPADALEGRDPVAAERLEERELRLDRDDVGRDRVDDPAAEARGVRGLCAAEHRLAAELDGQQVEARIDADDELAALPLDRVRKPVGEGRGRDGCHAERLGSGADLRQRQHAQLRRRAAERRSAAARPRRLGLTTAPPGRPPRGRPPPRSPCVAVEERPHGGDAAARDEVGPPEAVLGGRHEQAELERSEPLELGERAADLLERGDPVAQARRVLEAQVGGQPAQPCLQRRQGRGRLAVPVAERARRRLRAASASAARAARARR